VSQTDRRAVLRSGLAVAALGALGAASGCTAKPAARPARHGLIGPGSPQVAAAETARHATGGTVLAGVAPQAGHVDLGGPVVPTWSCGGQIPGPEIRPGQQVACDFDASNPGQWMTHCHNLYHAPQGGMMAMLSYET